MAKIIKKTIAFAMILAMVVAVFSGCEKEEQTAVTDTIYIGHHYQPEDDPYWVSEITGEGVMDPVKQKAAIAALETVKEELGVDIKWKQWPNGVTQDCLQTVLAGDPYAHIAILSNGFQGRVMVQNVLQPLDNYMDIFDSNEDYQWLKMGKTFGHYYLLNRDLLYITDWPIVYNATMLDEIPELKEEDGTTLYPVEMYEKGDWTWDNFRWYLETIQNYYAGKKAESGAAIVPFDARYHYTAIQAIHSSGGYVYDGEGMNFNSPEAIEGAEYLAGLMEDGLVSCTVAKFGSNSGAGYLQSVDMFARGETVFNNCARWKMGSSSTMLAERGESMGIIFFPRPDSVPFKEYNNDVHLDKNYRYNIGISCADSVGLLRGFDEAESRLALEAYAMYRTEFYKNYGQVESIQEYRDTMAESEAVAFGIDIFHEEIGDKNLEVFKMLGSLTENEYCEGMNVHERWGNSIFGRSVYGISGATKYATYVKANEHVVSDALNNIQTALKGSGAVDSTQPGISQTKSGIIAFEKGTDPRTIKWIDMFSANDNVDGKYELKQDEETIVDENGNKITVYGDIYIKPSVVLDAEDEEAEAEFLADRMFVEYEYKEEVNPDSGEKTIWGIDFNKVGKYEKGIKISVTDSQGNTRVSTYVAYIYEPNGTRPPSLVLKDEKDFGKIGLNADTSTVKWADLFVKEAIDQNGIDVRSFVSADVSSLDVTVKGKYPVVIYVKDLAGLKTSKTITVTVE